MRPRDALVRELRARGELWECAPGLVGLRGDALATLRTLEARIAASCAAESPDEWRVPAAIPLGVLERARYFASFPQWLTLASHLTDDEAALERVAASAAPARAAAEHVVPAETALPPAVCYHVYAALADTTVAAPRIVTAQGCCWRHEGDRVEPLARGWAFTMREIVCIGSEADCASFRERGIRIAQALAGELALDHTLTAAEDPFFAPTARGRALLQRLKALKHELRLSVGDGETVAAASFNLHERFFGEAFDIRLPDGQPAHTACVAFGLERWLLAALLRAPTTRAPVASPPGALPASLMEVV
jgi:seryl-tRNA synthetase